MKKGEKVRGGVCVSRTQARTYTHNTLHINDNNTRTTTTTTTTRKKKKKPLEAPLGLPLGLRAGKQTAGRVSE